MQYPWVLLSDFPPSHVYSEEEEAAAAAGGGHERRAEEFESRVRVCDWGLGAELGTTG